MPNLPTQDVPPADGLETTPQLPKLLQVTPRCLENWRKVRRLPFLKINKAVRFHVPSVMAALRRFVTKEVQ